MKHSLYIVVLAMLTLHLFAAPVDLPLARQAALNQLEHIGAAFTDVSLDTTLRAHDATLGYVFAVQPTGYVVVSASTDLPPVIAYSVTGGFHCHNEALLELVTADLANRAADLAVMPAELLAQHRADWDALLSGAARQRFEQWPPEGTTSTGGWVETRWTQNSPYNLYCPVDLGSGSRAVAGCPAVAMGQIVAYWNTLLGTRFSDDDDYHHNYNGQNYWIDDDAETYDFPTFPELNTLLDTLDHHMRDGAAYTNHDKGALVFACGVAAQQVYAAGGSGTFGVSQAYAAYQRFGFTSSVLLTADSTNVYERMADNIRNAMPVHLAVVNEAWTSGHNVVADGYNTEDYFHINFGWGGQSDGWYLLPDQFPYSLTVLEGVVVDIQPPTYTTCWPDTLNFLTIEQCVEPQVFTVVNMYTDSLTVEAVQFDVTLGGAMWDVDTPALPCVLQPGESFNVSLSCGLPTRTDRDTLSAILRVVLDQTSACAVVRLNSELVSDLNDPADTGYPLRLSNSPNPFNPTTTVAYSLPAADEVSLAVYNSRGQLVKTLVSGPATAGAHEVIWNGRDDAGRACASGVYFCRLSTSIAQQTTKMLLLK